MKTRQFKFCSLVSLSIRTFKLLEIVIFICCLFCRNIPAYWMWDNWKSCWDCWRKRRKDSPHQNRYWQTVKTSKCYCFYFISVLLELEKNVPNFIRSAACSVGYKSMETRCFFAITRHWFTCAWAPYVFPPMAPVSCFPALGAGVIFLRARHCCYVFPRLAMLSGFATFVHR